MIQQDMVAERLPNKTIIDLIATFDRVRFENNLKYAEGKNVAILSRVFKDTKAPHNNTPVSYARKIINTVSGYLYKPGYINYTSDK